MSDGTAIEWADATWNPILGCSKVSPGCDICYAIVNANIRKSNPDPKVALPYAGLVRRDAAGSLDWTGKVNTVPDRLDQPIRWRKPRKIFVNAQSDLFHEAVSDEFIVKIFAVMAVTRRHTYQVLTKRHGRMKALLNQPGFSAMVNRAIDGLVKDGTAKYHDAYQGAFYGHVWPLRNLWLGVSVEDQKRADLRIPALLATPATVRWLSCEPLLGPVDLRGWIEHTPVARGGYPAYVDWVVVGGESGTGARPMHPAWTRALRDQCIEAGVPYLFKQWGAWTPDRSGQGKVTANRFRYDVQYIGPNGEQYTAINSPDMDPTWAPMFHKGKKLAGRVLDGRTWDEYPGAAS